MMELNKTYPGNALTILKSFPDEFFNCCITSPPYYGLRSYKTEHQIWGGDKNCQHEFGEEIIANNSGGGWNKPETRKNYPTIRLKNPIKERESKLSQGNFCIHCNAWKGELGLEPDFNLYLQHLWQIFDEVKRVLKKTGSCFVNLGDSYGGNQGKHNGWTDNKNVPISDIPQSKNISQYQAKSLLQIPSRFSIGMTDRGWILRNSIIWHKRNCMPSSASDRFTVDYEMMYFFTKSTKYYFEQQFEKIANSTNKDNRFIDPSKDTSRRMDRDFVGNPDKGGGMLKPNDQGRNKRCVWDITPKGLKESHFAVFPPELIITPIKAGCPEEGIALDPFIGSGTTGIVARKLNRNYVGIELNEDYNILAEKRRDKELGFFQ